MRPQAAKVLSFKERFAFHPTRADNSAPTNGMRTRFDVECHRCCDATIGCRQGCFGAGLGRVTTLLFGSGAGLLGRFATSCHFKSLP